MASKKIAHNTFEQVIETSHEIAKSAEKQVKETFNPLDMIRTSFTEEKNPQAKDSKSESKDTLSKDEKHTPLDFDNLNKSYADQDKQKIDAMKQRLFQLVKNDDEKTATKTKQEKAQKERTILQEEDEKKRREQEQRRQQSYSTSPQGKLKGGKRKRPAEPQPAETKPGSSKQ